MCAGVTTFNAIRNAGARPGDLVAVHGIGGLGHLAVQYAVKMGFRTVAVGRGADKATLATSFGAHRYIDSAVEDPAKALADMGGARLVVATVTDADAMSAMIGGLGIEGTLIVIGAPPAPLSVPVFPMILGNRRVQGWYSGTSMDSQDALGFSLLTGVRSMNETYPLARVVEAYDRMMSGKARFRVVVRMHD
jgi:D-arabinose 1-dehydrogenase-like Zn-dependent alcohol dehydrogenase